MGHEILELKFCGVCNAMKNHGCLRCHNKELREELAIYKENDNKSRCSYCGEIGSDDMARVAKHMSECKARPENALLEEIHRLRAALMNIRLKAYESNYESIFTIADRALDGPEVKKP